MSSSLLAAAVTAAAAGATVSPASPESLTMSQTAFDAAIAASAAEATTAATAAAHERLGTILADDRSKGRERAALDLAVASPTMSAEQVLAFVANHAAPANAGASRLDALVSDPAVTADAPEGKPSASAGLASAVDREIARR